MKIRKYFLGYFVAMFMLSFVFKQTWELTSVVNCRLNGIMRLPVAASTHSTCHWCSKSLKVQNNKISWLLKLVKICDFLKQILKFVKCEFLSYDSDPVWSRFCCTNWELTDVLIWCKYAVFYCCCVAECCCLIVLRTDVEWTAIICQTYDWLSH